MVDLDSYNSLPTRPRRRRWYWYVAAAAAGVLCVWALGRWGGESFTIVRRLGQIVQSGDNPQNPGQVSIADDPEYEMPDNDKSRLDILVLGIRGRDDVANGGLLTDTILLFSLDTKTGVSALTSIPRDLTLRITDSKTEKVNAAYALNGLSATKRLFSRITGTYIDNVVVVDFAAFQHIVDALGGITITLDKPFTETQQWGYEFTLPAGPNDLTGEQALYYSRSRYGTSDFDRSRRQMQVLMAMKAKAESLDLAADPIKAIKVITTVRKHIETDLDILDLGTIRQLMEHGGEIDHIKRYQLTTENMLYEAKINGIYELLPRQGSLAHVKEFFDTVLTDHPVIFTPTPTPAPTASPTP